MITSTNGSAVDARSGIGGKQMNNDNGGEALAGDSAAAGMAGSVEYGQKPGQRRAHQQASERPCIECEIWPDPEHGQYLPTMGRH